MEDVLKRHRQEQRDLQARITQKKKSATKKTRKGINDECAELERQLKARQNSELSGVIGATVNEQHDAESSSSHPAEGSGREEKSLDDNVNYISISSAANEPVRIEDPTQEDEATKGKKPNRQKARLARRAAEHDAIVAQAANEAADLPDHREQERLVMQKELTARRLIEKDIPPDGHCLYAAVADQLIYQGISLAKDSVSSDNPGYKVVRQVAADFIMKNPADFAPFLEEPLEDYVVKIRNTGEWGGQLELSALARAYNIRIHVLQGAGRVEKIEPGSNGIGKLIWLAYYRHTYGLGEHYNSLHVAA